MNKIIVSIVFAIILVLGINKVTDVIFYVEKPEKSAYQVASVTTVASTTSAETDSTNSELWKYYGIVCINKCCRRCKSL